MKSFIGGVGYSDELIEDILSYLIQAVDKYIIYSFG